MCEKKRRSIAWHCNDWEEKGGKIDYIDWEYLRKFPNFQNCVHCENDLKDNKHNCLHLTFKIARIFTLDILCSSCLTVFIELRSRKTIRFSGQIMSGEKYPSIFSRQTEVIVYLTAPWTDTFFWVQYDTLKMTFSGSLISKDRRDERCYSLISLKRKCKETR